MHVLFAKDGIEYGPLDANTLAGAIECISDVFIKNEPMTRYLGITRKEFIHFASAAYPPLAEEGLSFVARDSQTGQIIGCRVSEDFCQAAEMPPIPGLSPKFLPLFAALEELGGQFFEMRDVVPGKYIHLFMVAVRDGFTGKGVAPNMNKIFFRHVKNRGFTHAVTEPTGAISQHILVNKFGFKILKKLSYKDFEYEGKKVFKGIQEHEGIMLLEKDLSEITTI